MEEEPVPTPLGGTLQGRYRVLRHLGAGGMAAVYLAEDETLHRPVVVKIPHAAALTMPGFRERFEKEVRALIRFEHPHVVKVLDAGALGETPYAVLQYLSGGSLADRLASGVQSPAATLDWLRDVADALDFLHAKGMVHRDVKPGNVLFDGDAHVFLSDFGIVKVLDGLDPNLTNTAAIAGSPAYMAPEQAMGDTIAGAADQYALSVTLYEALAGRTPFEASSPLSILMRKQSEPPSPLGSAAPHLPPEAAAAVHRALSKDPSARFPSCRAFAEAFHAGLAGTGRERTQSASGQATGAAPTTAAVSPRARWPWLAGLSAVLVGVGFAVTASRSERATPALPAAAGGAGTSWTKDLVPESTRAYAAAHDLAPTLEVPLPRTVPLRFVLIPPGTFRMGPLPDSSFASSENQPAHAVHLTHAYYLQVTEVTNGQYRTWPEAAGHETELVPEVPTGTKYDANKDLLPVGSVSWTNARRFADWVGSLRPSHRFRLPTEAEWEYACRGGVDADVWWDAREKSLADYANVADRAAHDAFGWQHAVTDLQDNFAEPSMCGALDPNPWGLHDMLGNVFEWCEDSFHAYPRGEGSDPVEQDDDPNKVERGGSYAHAVEYASRFFRGHMVADVEAPATGFRLAAVPSER